MESAYFVKADSKNLPFVDPFMMAAYSVSEKWFHDLNSQNIIARHR